jgi:predicted metal-dependent hydrolase
MQKWVVNNREIIINKRRGLKRVSLRVFPDGKIKVSLPWLMPSIMAKTWLLKQNDWIEDRLKKINQLPAPKKLSRQEMVDCKIKTRNLVRQRLEYFNQFYGYQYMRITIRDQKTRWGSCSSNKTLSFNLRLALVDPELADYVIVHELCHLKEMNHSRRFWDLVAKTVPDYPIRRRKLMRIGSLD